MKTKIIITALFFFSTCILLFNSCCKTKCQDPTNPKCENYDPCFKKRPNAGFKMRESLWDDVSQTFNENLVPYVGFHDTISGQSLDIFADFEPINGIKYNWKFDGMSSIIELKDLKRISFFNYIQNTNNYLPLWDSFYTKPLGVTLTVTVPQSSCIGYDTIYTQKKYITFARQSMYFGKFKGYFSTAPTKEVEIIINDSVVKNMASRHYSLYGNFPYHEKDTIIQDELRFIGSTPVENERVYNRRDWSINVTKSYNLDRLKGILGIHFEGYFNQQTARNEVKFNYLFQKSITDPIENITFTGYQLEAYRRPFGL